jgi:drug/metabolite transporter (DMT)-like permease
MKRAVLFAHLGLLLESLLYAGSYTFAKGLVPYHLSPFELTLIRTIFATLIFGTIFLVSVREKVSRKDLMVLAFCSLIGISISNILFFQGLSLTTPINGALITLSAPLFLILFAIVLYGEIELRKLLGVAVGAAGGAFLVMGDTGSAIDADNPALGNLLIGMSAGAYAVYLMLIKPVLTKYNPITILMYLFLFAALSLLPFYGPNLLKVRWEHFTPEVWTALVFILLTITFITFLLNMFALKVLDPSIVSTYIYTTPLLTAMIAVLGNQQGFSINLVIAGVLILGGGYLVSSTQSSNNEEALPEETQPSQEGSLEGN